MILVAPNMVVTDYLETVSLKTIDDITEATQALITYYGKSYTDEQKIAMDDFFEGIKVASYYSKLKHLLLPFLAPNMTSAQIAADKATANKAFFDFIQNKLPDGTMPGQSNLFVTSNASYFKITDEGIVEETQLPSGSTYSLRAIYSEDVTSANLISVGFKHNCTYNSTVGNNSLSKDGATVSVGASTSITNYNISDNAKLVMVNHGATSGVSIAINNDITTSPTSFNANNYDTTVKTIKLFNNATNEVNKAFTFGFIADLMSNAELSSFYASTKALLSAFGL
jgi:hypothetical protein